MHFKSTIAAVVSGAALLTAAPALATPTINASPNPTTAGDPVVIFGHAAPNAKVVLWHRINPAPRFTIVQTTKADANGNYEFTRAEGVVVSNRNWYVTVGNVRNHSTIVHEKVNALVTVTGPAEGALLTATPYTYAGTVSPNHAGEKVFLQRDNADTGGGNWHNIDKAVIQPDGSYTIVHRYTSPGDANIRVHFKGDRRNIASDSDVLTYAISQKQNNRITIASSANPINEGGSTDISGQVLKGANPTIVTLYAHVAGRGFAPVATTQSDASGNYTFAGQVPVSNTYYRVGANDKLSAILFEGVKDVVTASVDKTSITAGDTVTFSGSVSPDKSGHVIYLERQNDGGKGWHIVQQSKVGTGSVFSFTRRIVNPGTKVFRILITGGPVNEAGASAPITITAANNPAPLTAS